MAVLNSIFATLSTFRTITILSSIIIAQFSTTTILAQTSILEGNLEQNIFFIDSSEKIIFVDFAEIDQTITNIAIEKEGTIIYQYDTNDLSSKGLSYKKRMRVKKS